MFGVGVFTLAMGSSQSFGQGRVINLDFNSDPSVEFPDIVFFGNAAEWIPDGGVDNTGYLKITNAENDQSGAIILPDVGDPPGEPLSSFKITAELRVGGGTDSPADGFSFNLVRPDDPLLEDPPGAFAGNQEDANASLPEEGSRTGLGIGFDEWQSGAADPDATATDCGSLAFDCVGMSVRVDGELILQAPFPIRNGAVDDQASLQTGPAATPAEELGWAVLDIQVTPDLVNDANSNIRITYKDRLVISESIPYQPTPGQLVFGGRTGGANSNHHIDNISLVLDFVPDQLGDFNRDGVVDTVDFNILASNFNTSGPDITDADGDIDFNGSVNMADFIAFRQAFAEFQGGGGLAAVPEPHSFLLAAFGLFGLGLIRRRTK